MRFSTTIIAAALAASSAAAVAQTVTPALPEPTRDPLAIDPASDPVIQLSHTQAPPPAFRAAIASAVERNPGRGEAEATAEEARALRAEAVQQGLPTIDATVTNFQTLARDFSNDPQNIVERSRARERTDALLSVTQPIIDFGASRRRIEAAAARIEAASWEIDSASQAIALRAIAAWYDVFGYRALVALSESFADSQRELEDAIELRIKQGVSAEGDTARVESFVAGAETRAAQYRRALANAEARYAELIGAPPPDPLLRAPPPDSAVMSKDRAVAEAARSPQVRAAEAIAESTRNEAKATRAETLPQVSAGLDAGRYGVFETDRDYDIRARVTLRQRFFGGVDPRADQAEARATGATARAARIREEAVRDAAIAWSDVQALETALAALERTYIASRTARDVLFERFRVARGNLFDLLDAEETYFGAATAYIETLIERDTARYALLARTGELLDSLEIKEEGRDRL